MERESALLVVIVLIAAQYRLLSVAIAWESRCQIDEHAKTVGCFTRMRVKTSSILCGRARGSQGLAKDSRARSSYSTSDPRMTGTARSVITKNLAMISSHLY